MGSKEKENKSAHLSIWTGGARGSLIGQEPKQKNLRLLWVIRYGGQTGTHFRKR